MHYAPHPGPTITFIAVLAVLLLIAARVAAHALIRIAVPTRLRDAE
jgi:hypothetical protein